MAKVRLPKPLIVLFAALIVIAGCGKKVESLIEALGDENQQVRMNAAEALGDIGTPAVEPLIKALGDENEYVRMYAATALGKIGDARAVEPLIKTLGDEKTMIHPFSYNRWVRERAAAALGEIGTPAVEPLIKALGDENGYVRMYAAKALGEIGDARAVESLIKALGDEKRGGRMSAAKALGKIGDARAVEPLIKALGDEDNLVREYAAEALGNIGDQRAIPGLVDGLADWDVGPENAAALHKLGWQPSLDDETVRFNVAKRYKQMLLRDWEITRRVLLADVASGDSRRVKNAVYAFVGIGREEILEDLIRILNAQGTVEMAETFLNCGNERLLDEARDWAPRHGYGYTIMPGAGEHAIRWGEMPRGRD